MNTIFLVIISLIIIILFLFYVFFILEKYDPTDPKLKELRDKLEQVDPAAKGILLSKGAKSYSINKHVVYLCLYNEDGKYYDDHLLFYVALHELAHVKNKTIGHDDSFYKEFEELLNKAEKLGFYDPSKSLDKDYCTFND
jgi:hypothetical protein